MFAPGSSFKAIAGSYETLVLSGLPGSHPPHSSLAAKTPSEQKDCSPGIFSVSFFWKNDYG